MKINRNFLGGEGGGCKTKKAFRGGRMNIFWNCTMHVALPFVLWLVLCLNLISVSRLHPAKGPPYSQWT